MVVRHRSRRQARASGMPMGWPGTERQRVLKANATKAKNKMPAVNFERRAPARLRANSMAFFRLGLCHISANRHSVSKENSVTAMSVRTRGPKVRKAGVVTYMLRQIRPPQFSPRRRACIYKTQPSTSVRRSIGRRAHVSVVRGLFHLVRSHSPKTHCPKRAEKNSSLNVQEMWE